MPKTQGVRGSADDLTLFEMISQENIGRFHASALTLPLILVILVKKVDASLLHVLNAAFDQSRILKARLVVEKFLCHLSRILHDLFADMLVLDVAQELASTDSRALVLLEVGDIVTRACEYSVAFKAHDSLIGWVELLAVYLATL